MNPVAFRIFGLEVRWYGILIAIGVFIGMLLATRLSKKTPGLPSDVVEELILWALPLGVLGARLYYVLFSWDYYKVHPNEIFMIRNGGLAIHGGVIMGILVGILYTKVKKISFWKLADCIAPSLVLAQGIGRWGNFMNQEAHGGPTDLPWGIMIDGVKVHPTFLYESIWDVGICLLLYFYIFPRKEFDGKVFLMYGILYSIGRFFIEGLRTDSLMIGPLRIAQVMSLLIIISCLIGFVYLKRESNS